MRLPTRGGLIRAALAAAALLAAPLPAAAQAPTGAPGGDAVARGRYLAEAADCMPCHTAPGGARFAGGRAINTPFGTITSPNITPDAATGIGRWTADQFWGALHEGIRADGAYLYPVMPFPSYTRIARADADAIFAYLRSLPPADAPRRPNGLEFPFDVRATMAVWRELFFRPADFTPDPARSAEWNRGAYLGTALGHCGACHSPRNVMGATEQSRPLRGGVVDGWFAPDVAPADPRSAVAGWTVDRIAQWLRTGAAAGKGTAFGPMAEVVHDSLSKLTDADLRALATWLHDSAPPAPPGPASRPDPQAASLYLANCAGCHQPLGVGIPGAIPPLAGNPAVLAAQPNNVVQAVLNGIPAQGAYGPMPSFAATLTDAQVAAIANYVRTAWTPAPAGAAPATADGVAALRAADPLSGLSTEAARRFCPAVGPFGPNLGMAPVSRAAFALMRGADSGDLTNRAPELARRLREDNPGIGGAELVDALITAYCPAVANDPALTDDQRRFRLDQFRAAMEQELARPQGPVIAVQVTAELPPEVLARAEAAARAAGLPLGAWLARVAREAAAAPGAAAPRR